MRKIKFGIIGCGKIASRHAEHITSYGELAAVCDIKEDLAKGFAEKFHCNYYTSIEELLKNEKEIEVISICTPNGLHAEHSIKSLRAGKHVLCEKPMALSVKDCERMIREAEDANKRLFVVMKID